MDQLKQALELQLKALLDNSQHHEKSFKVLLNQECYRLGLINAFRSLGITTPQEEDIYAKLDTTPDFNETN